MIYLIPLLFAVILNHRDSERLAVSLTILAVTAVSYSFYTSPGYDLIVNAFGYWGYCSLAPLLSCVLLWYCRGKTPFALTGLFTTIILINLVCLFLDKIMDVEDVYQGILHVLYVVEVMILLSRRVTDVIANFYSKVFDQLRLHLVPAHFLSLPPPRPQ